MIKTLKFPFILLSFLLAGCAAVGPDFEPPRFETPETYRFADTVEKEINLNWWQLFQDPILFTLVSTALENNRDLKIAASRIEEARASLGFTRADQYPRVDVEAGASTGNFAGGSRSETTNSTAFIAPVLSWEIDFWGKFRRATEAARAELMAGEYALKTVQLSLVSEVVSAYYLLLDYHNRLRISENTLESRLESLDIINQRFEKGIIPEIDLNQAQIQKEIAAAAIPQFERLIAKTENTLSILAGRLPEKIRTGDHLSYDYTPPEIPVDLPSNILDRRPDIVEARYLLEARTARIGVAEALRYPAISLTGALGVASTELSSITSEGSVWSVGAGLVGPLIDFDKNKRRVEIEEERTRQALYAYENTVLTAFREVEDALVEIATYKAQLAATQNKFNAAHNANALSRERYDKGISSYLEVLDTERTLFSVSLEQSELTQLYLNAYVKLYKALGGGWISGGDDSESR